MRELESSIERAEAYHFFVIELTPMVIEILSDSDLSNETVISGFPIEE